MLVRLSKISKILLLLIILILLLISFTTILLNKNFELVAENKNITTKLAEDKKVLEKPIENRNIKESDRTEAVSQIKKEIDYYPIISPNGDKIVIFSTDGNHKIFYTIENRQRLLQDLFIDNYSPELSKILSTYSKGWGSVIWSNDHLRWLDNTTFIILKIDRSEEKLPVVVYLFDFKNDPKISVKEIPIELNYSIYDIDSTLKNVLISEQLGPKESPEYNFYIYNLDTKSKKFFLKTGSNTRIHQYDILNNGFVLWDSNKNNTEYVENNIETHSLYFYSLSTGKVKTFDVNYRIKYGKVMEGLGPFLISNKKGIVSILDSSGDNILIDTQYEGDYGLEFNIL